MKKVRLKKVLDNVVGRSAGFALILLMFHLDTKYSYNMFNKMDIFLLISIVVGSILIVEPISDILLFVRNTKDKIHSDLIDLFEIEDLLCEDD